MRKVILFIAMSLDGCIADPVGGVSWLAGQDADAEVPDTYSDFIRGVDTVVMGHTTYRQIVDELSPNEWPYRGLTSYIITHHPAASSDNGIRFVCEPPAALVRRLRGQEGKDIWICGGASIVHALRQEDLIDRYHITLIPTLLGGGLPLFAPTGREQPLRLVRTQSYNGMTELVYERR